MQLSLFDSATIKEKAPVLRYEEIPGLLYIPDFLSQQEEQHLIQKTDSGLWLNDLKRRVQHYGYKYDYKSRGINSTMRLGALPSWINEFALKLFELGHFEDIPDQVIINEYMPGQGITPHIDCEPCFGKTIASISMGSQCIMEFAKEGKKLNVILEQRSMIIIQSDARLHWTHSIPSRKSDIINGVSRQRSRRVSMTFRKVTF